MAAELENEHLNRPLLFEPALRQYSAYRAGEPAFETRAEANRWFSLRSRVLQHILMIIATFPGSEHLILRGSAMMALWFGEAARRPGDLDWVVTPDSWSYECNESQHLLEGVQQCLRGTSGSGDVEFVIPDRPFAGDDIWTYEKAPGRRLIVPWICEEPRLSGTVQMDFVFGEFMPSPAVKVQIGTLGESAVEVAAATPEQSLAWKLLWLESDCYGQGKDLYDAVLLAERVTLDAALLRETFVLGLPEVRIEPLRGFNESAVMNWHIEWHDFQQEYRDISGSEHDWKKRLAVALRPLFAQLGESVS
ncbi:MAG: nucleotidyl transferase AbiEii/AbiGii toxin family protein [Pirellulales bacterium]